MDEMQPLIFSINRDQNMSSTHSTVVVYLHCQYKLKHIFTLPKAAWLPMSVPPSRMSCLCWGATLLWLLPVLALHIGSLETALSTKQQLLQRAAWQGARGQHMGGKMGLDAEGEGVLAACGSTGTICSGSSLNSLGGLE